MPTVTLCDLLIDIETHFPIRILIFLRYPKNEKREDCSNAELRFYKQKEALSSSSLLLTSIASPRSLDSLYYLYLCLFTRTVHIGIDLSSKIKDAFLDSNCNIVAHFIVFLDGFI